MGKGGVRSALVARAAFAAVVAFVSAPAAADPASLTSLGFSGIVDLRFGLTDGEQSWRDGGFGKLRFGGDHGDFTPDATIGDAHLLWQPRLGAWRAHVDAQLQPDSAKAFGLNEAWIAWHPQPKEGGLNASARTGLFYPPISLENDGPGWTTTRTVTPSAINSWIGEEVKPVAGEVRIEVPLAGGTIAATGALFEVNDTAGALLTFRGWAMHDLTTVLGQRQPLPPLSGFAADLQPRFTTPIYKLDKRIGWYGQVEWKSAEKLTVNAFWYDNRGDKTSLDEDFQWAWRTRFADVGIRYAIDGRTELLAQAVAGSAKMGFHYEDQLWFDNDFQSAYLLASRQIGHGMLSGRVDWMHVHDRTLKEDDDNAEHGWALTAAYLHPLADWATLTLEALHVDSDRPGRDYGGIAATQRQTQLQAALRCYF